MNNQPYPPARICSNCHRNIPTDATYCGYCGTPALLPAAHPRSGNTLWIIFVVVLAMAGISLMALLIGAGGIGGKAQVKSTPSAIVPGAAFTATAKEPGLVNTTSPTTEPTAAPNEPTAEPTTTAPTLPNPPSDGSQPTGKIVYTCETLQPDNVYDQLCIINADGSGERRLTDSVGASNYYPALSPDGKTIIYVSNVSGDHDIYEMNIKSGKITRLTKGLGTVIGPRISPDGSQVVFAKRKENSTSFGIFTMDRSGSNIRLVYGKTVATRPAWTRDGRIIFFDYATSQILIMDANGDNVEQLTDGPALGGSADLSPDGSIVAVFYGKEPNRQIYLEDAFGSQVRQLTTGVDNLGPTFSPDGQWLAFTSYGVGSDRHDKCKIYIMRVDGSEYRQLTHNKICDWLPYWGN